MKELRLTRRGLAAWVHWRSRRHHRRAASEEWQRFESCHRCAYLEARVAGLLAELEVAGAAPGERVVVVYQDADGKATFGRRVGALIDALLRSFREHRWVWAFIYAVVFGVIGYIVYQCVALMMNG